MDAENAPNANVAAKPAAAAAAKPAGGEKVPPRWLQVSALQVALRATADALRTGDAEAALAAFEALAGCEEVDDMLVSTLAMSSVKIFSSDAYTVAVLAHPRVTVPAGLAGDVLAATKTEEAARRVLDTFSADEAASVAARAIPRVAYAGRAPALRAALARAGRGAVSRRGDTHGETALHQAAHGASVECVEVLLSAGASLGALDKLGRAPLMFAAASKRHKRSAAVVRLLVARGANASQACPDGRTPLSVACERGNGAAARALLELGADAAARVKCHRGMTALCEAARTGSEAAARAVLELRGLDGTLATRALGVAAYHGRVGVARALLEHGVPPDGGDAGEPPLAVALGRKQDEVAVALLEGGASAGRAARRGLYYAAALVQRLGVHPLALPQDAWDARGGAWFEERWAAGVHPAQLERRAVERALSRVPGMPADLERLVGDFCHARQRVFPGTPSAAELVVLRAERAAAREAEARRASEARARKERRLERLHRMLS